MEINKPVSRILSNFFVIFVPFNTRFGATFPFTLENHSRACPRLLKTALNVARTLALQEHKHRLYHSWQLVFRCVFHEIQLFPEI